MNIYMTGSSGTGKTSLAEELCDRLGMYEAPSVARTSPYKMRTQDCQDYVMHCVDYQCRMATESVVTRTPIDVFGYSYVWNLDITKPTDVSTRFLEDDPIVLYLPKYWEPEDDGFRPVDGQDEVDNAIDYGLSVFYHNAGLKREEANLYTVLNESIDDRATHVIEWLAKRGVLV